MDNPTAQQVQEIYKYTYLLYVKFKDSKTDADYQNFINESNNLSKKYPFELCEHQILDIANILNEYAKRRQQ